MGHGRDAMHIHFGVPGLPVNRRWPEMQLCGEYDLTMEVLG